MSALLTVKDVALCYHLRKQLFKKPKEIWALKSVSFELNKGEKLGIIGRNGMGKSSLMKMLAGIFEPTKGTLVWHQKVHVQLLSLGVGFEGSLTGRENAVLNGMLLGKSRRVMLERVEAIKEFSELGDFFEYPVNTYSSGMVMRLGFAVAIECDPDVLLLDELMAVGDANFQDKCKRVLAEKMTAEKTVILISHDEKAIKSFCNRVLWIEDGTVRNSGSPDEMFKLYLKEAVRR